ncbi:hypothetical protein [Marinobacter adhaerens]|uniref:Uncharacterized protein n=2 Tax=Marinobacter adhaerens TaxID=1033846 RepID=A0ABX8IN06_9GAMM|nr:hypothetical protein [Marinobacter adhaerens]ADP96425.1 hypothetical protein HP15_661 [Marinobacter adhaerens HP15]QWV14415.1 hypothetical protein KQ249_07430 [Marinobacter adhaerens]
MELKSYYAQDNSGEVIPGAHIYLYETGTTTLVTGLKDASGSAVPNPFQADQNGLFQVSAPDGVYDLRVSSAGRDSTIQIQFLDASEALEAINENADRAEAARDAAFINAEVYETVSDGLLNTQDGEQFTVISPNGLEAIRYRNDGGGVGGSEVEVARYTTSSWADEIANRASSNEVRSLKNKSDGVDRLSSIIGLGVTNAELESGLASMQNSLDAAMSLLNTLMEHNQALVDALIHHHSDNADTLSFITADNGQYTPLI